MSWVKVELSDTERGFVDLLKERNEQGITFKEAKDKLDLSYTGVYQLGSNLETKGVIVKHRTRRNKPLTIHFADNIGFRDNDVFKEEPDEIYGLTAEGTEETQEGETNEEEHREEETEPEPAQTTTTTVSQESHRQPTIQPHLQQHTTQPIQPVRATQPAKYTPQEMVEEPQAVGVDLMDEEGLRYLVLTEGKAGLNKIKRAALEASLTHTPNLGQKTIEFIMSRFDRKPAIRDDPNELYRVLQTVKPPNLNPQLLADIIEDVFQYDALYDYINKENEQFFQRRYDPVAAGVPPNYYYPQPQPTMPPIIQAPPAPYPPIARPPYPYSKPGTQQNPQPETAAPVTMESLLEILEKRDEERRRKEEESKRQQEIENMKINLVRLTDNTKQITDALKELKQGLPDVVQKELRADTGGIFRERLGRIEDEIKKIPAIDPRDIKDMIDERVEVKLPSTLPYSAGKDVLEAQNEYIKTLNMSNLEKYKFDVEQELNRQKLEEKRRTRELIGNQISSAVNKIGEVVGATLVEATTDTNVVPRSHEMQGSVQGNTLSIPCPTCGETIVAPADTSVLTCVACGGKFEKQ